MGGWLWQGLIFPIPFLPSTLNLAGAQEAGKGGSQWLPPIEEVWKQDIVLGSPLLPAHNAAHMTRYNHVPGHSYIGS